ncbi:MAG: methyltransferase domain-containing protein [Candidatus Eremiobacteraeota bacterium]|nr:methyltransferase domain-containing protein [Candidatus Eremiobacteraeota bacterium]
MGSTVPSRYFTKLYDEQLDPWNFASSEYEGEKYRRTLEALPRSRYRRACELACSIGVFTRLLATKCDRLFAVDVSDVAVKQARERCKHESHVKLQQMDLLRAYPKGSFDLTTVCEFGYYFAADDLLRLCENVVAHSVPGAHVVLVHWTPPVRGHALTAKDVHDAFGAHPQLRSVQGFDAETYRLDVFERA